MKHIKRELIQVSAFPGSSIRECAKESIILALQENTDVKLIHNCIGYLIKIGSIYKTVDEVNENNNRN